MEIQKNLEKLKLIYHNPIKIPYYVRRTLKGVRGSVVCFHAPGKVGLFNTYYLRPKVNELLILTNSTLVSPGTERAFLNNMPNTGASYPYYPGYSGAGEVVMIGPKVTRFSIGDRVVSRCAHTSLWLSTEDQFYHIPYSISYDEASFFTLAVIAAQGFRKGNIKLGDRIVIFGQGLIGQLTLQLASASGAYPITAVAKSKARLEMSMLSGAHRFISLDEEPSELCGLDADVVIETSGNPAAIKDTINCCKVGGRIVLLGSPRGISNDLDFNTVQKRNLTIVGAHQSNMPIQEGSGEWWPVAKEVETFFALLLQRKYKLDHLMTNEVSPREAEWFYQRLSKFDPTILGAIFHWDKFPYEQRIKPAPFIFSLRKRCTTIDFSNQQGKLNSAFVKSDGKFPAYNIKDQQRKGVKTNHPPLRIGLIGCGEISVLNAVAVNSSPDTELTMVMDVNETLAKDLADKYNVPYTTEIERVLSNKHVDVVLISVPHYLHAPIVIKSAESNKHVIVEKPISMNALQADEIIRICHRADVVMSVLFCGRYQSHIQLTKQLVIDGALGELLGVSVLFQTNKPTSYWTGGYSGRAHTDWRSVKEKSGGGIFISNIVHYLDIIRYLTEAEVVQVFTELGSHNTSMEVEDSIGLTLRYDNEAIGVISGSSCSPGTTGRLEINLWGTDGNIILRNPALVKYPLEFYSLHNIKGYNASQWHKPEKLTTINDREAFVSRFAQAVNYQKPPDITGEDARIVQAIVDAVYESAEIGQSVKVT